MRKRVRRGLAVGFAFALALAMTLWGWQRISRTAGPVGADRLEIQWHAGAMQSYRISLVSDVHLELDNQEASEFQQVLSGVLRLRVFEVGPDYVRLGFQLGSPRYLVAGQRDAILEKRLATPFFARFERSGRPESFEFPNWFDVAEATLLEEAVRAFQVQLPSERRLSWSIDESHATGTYLAQYELAKSAVLKKRKAGYSQLDPSVGFPGTAPSARVLDSRGSLRLSEVAWLDSALVHEELEIKGEGLLARTKLRAELELTRDRAADDAALFREPDPGMVRLASWANPAPEPPKSNQARQPRTLSPRATLDAILARWREEEPGRVARLRELLAALQATPGMAAEIAGRVRESATTGGESAMLIHSLERSGTPEAQAALAGLMTDPELHFANRLRAVVALGGVAGANDASLAALFDMSLERVGESDRDLANTALLSIGSIASGLRTTDPERAERLVDELERTLGSAGDANEMGMTIKALGNTHAPNRSESILPYLNHSSEFVRGSAARTIGQLDDDGASDRLADQLVKEESPRVRMALANGLVQVQNASQWSVRSVAKQVRQEPQATTRRAMATYLGENISKDEIAVAALKELAIADPSPSVRRYAASVLHQQSDD
ncbi:MAG: HEAT repeat domain-containing protein [Deltaproteobacteria bacterium]|nr:HEAT repeat domain-containing protein [Deltaproteobacteria bacterium]